MSPYDYFKDLPNIGEIVLSGANKSTPLIQWNTKVLYCQIAKLWYNTDIDSIIDKEIKDDQTQIAF